LVDLRSELRLQAQSIPSSKADRRWRSAFVFMILFRLAPEGTWLTRENRCAAVPASTRPNNLAPAQYNK
jgi:hypothetical protein